MTLELVLLPAALLVAGFALFLVMLSAATPFVAFIADVPAAVLHQAMFGGVKSLVLLSIPFFLFAGIPVLLALHFWETARNVTPVHPAIIVSAFLVHKRWSDRLPADIRTAMQEEGARLGRDVSAWTTEAIGRANATWTPNCGELIELPAAERAVLAEYRALAAVTQRHST